MVFLYVKLHTWNYNETNIHKYKLMKQTVLKNAPRFSLMIIIVLFGLFSGSNVNATQLKAGVAKVNITNTESVELIHD